MSNTTTESPIEIINQMSKWVNNIMGINREPREAYSIVCKHYDLFIKELNNSQKKTKSKNKKKCYKEIINKLREGYAKCSMWVIVEQPMEHFEELQSIISNQKRILEEE